MAKQKKLPHMPWYGDDYERDEQVEELSPLADLAYRRLLWAQWKRRGKGLPSDPEELAGLIRWRAVFRLRDGQRVEFPFAWVWEEVSGFFEPCGLDRVANPRLQAEWEKASERHRRSVENGRKGGRPPKEKTQNVTHGSTQTKTQNVTPGLSLGSGIHSQSEGSAEPHRDPPTRTCGLQGEKTQSKTQNVTHSESISELRTQSTLLRNVRDARACEAEQSADDPEDDTGRVWFRLTHPPFKLGDTKAREAIDRGVTNADLDAWEVYEKRHGGPALGANFKFYRHPDEIPVERVADSPQTRCDRDVEDRRRQILEEVAQRNGLDTAGAGGALGALGRDVAAHAADAGAAGVLHREPKLLRGGGGEGSNP